MNIRSPKFWIPYIRLLKEGLEELELSSLEKSRCYQRLLNALSSNEEEAPEEEEEDQQDISNTHNSISCFWLRRQCSTRFFPF